MPRPWGKTVELIQTSKNVKMLLNETDQGASLC